MAKFGKFDDIGALIGVYDTDIHGPLNRTESYLGEIPKGSQPGTIPPTLTREVANPNYPPNVVPITDDQWLELLANPSTRRWVDGGVVAIGSSSPTNDQAPVSSVRVISRGQFFTQLALDKVITEEEAEATSEGALPKLLLDALSFIEDDRERFKSRMQAKNAGTFEIDSPVVSFVAGVLGWDQERLLKLWSDASTL